MPTTTKPIGFHLKTNKESGKSYPNYGIAANVMYGSFDLTPNKAHAVIREIGLKPEQVQNENFRKFLADYPETKDGNSAVISENQDLKRKLAELEAKIAKGKKTSGI